MTLTPLILPVGFLGAGKTTFLRNLLPALHMAGVQPHVFLNDFQSAQVDVAMLEEDSASLRSISASCVCCGSREELLDALSRFPPEEGNVLIIEANGAVDPDQLIEMLTLDPRTNGFTLPCQLSVVDTTSWQERPGFDWMEAAQLRTSTHLFFSHSDIATPERLRAVQCEVSAIAPSAVTVTTESFAGYIASLRRAK
jgi:G3E family GTPase